jgi:pimeloyl-ACP methyl ester carboxylesterase
MTFNRAFVATCLLFSTARVATAQRQPVIFQHGIGSEASTWQSVADRLAGAFYLTPFRFTTGSQRTFEEQAAVYVGGAAGLPDTTFAVGHSNGGLVSREANRGGRNLRAIVTVGTLHTGAGLAGNVLNGEFSRYIGYLRGAVTLPVTTYGAYYPDSFWWNEGVNAAQWVNAFGTFFEQLPTILGLVYYPLLSEMTPGSNYLNTLNGAANLAREAAAVPNRIGIVSTLSDNDGVIFRTLFGPGDTWNLNADRNLARDAFYGAYFYYVFYDNYSDYNYYEKVQNAYMWRNAGLALQRQDGDWCYLIGAYIPTLHGCTPSDAIVPGDRQAYPQYTRLISQLDVAHTEETSSDVTFNTLSGLFGSGPLRITDLGPMSGAISGPSNVPLYEQRTWSAMVSGGHAPYSYTWLAGGAQLQSGASPNFSYTNQGSEFMVTVHVTDTAGSTITLNQWVTLYGSCGPEVMC